MTPPAATHAPAAGVMPHPDSVRWDALLVGLQAAMAARQCEPGRTVVLLPYLQLVAPAREAWQRGPGLNGGGLPRFETSRQWAQSLAPFEPGDNDISHDPARDSLLAGRWLQQVAGTRVPRELQSVLAARLCESAAQLAPLVAAVPPPDRPAWVAARRAALQAELGGSMKWESLVAALALEWAGSSDYPTDVLWSDQADAGCLVWVEGLAPDPLVQALAARWGSRAARLTLLDDDVGPNQGECRLHPCGDAEDEAHRAAACVIRHLAAGRQPVALVALDRQLSRRVCAWLEGAGVPVNDETGWRLSTTRAAAQLLALLRGASADASTDQVLDALKACPRWTSEQIDALERSWRRQEVSRWAEVLASDALRARLPEGLESLLDGLRAPRPLTEWLQAVAQAIRDAGLWEPLAQDAAGGAVIRALWLDDIAHALGDSPRRLSAAAFGAWVRDVLEGASFSPPTVASAPVVLLPLNTVAGRGFAAVVAAGCDASHLDPAPEPAGAWTPAQRAILGLPDRGALALSARRAWLALLRQPQLDLLWRTSDREEAVLPSPWVQGLLDKAAPAPDPRPSRMLQAQAIGHPQPRAPDLLPQALSASAYQDLRDCPYRFFALRQLGLSETPELDADPDKRDMGIWLHAVLREFHEQRPEPQDRDADAASLDRAAADQLGQLGLGQATFLPFRAAWPAVREAYLDWLHAFEARNGRPGPRFRAAEVECRVALGRWNLVGKLDRIDTQPAPEGDISLVIDYKTESRTRTRERVRLPMEDTQLAFYAALLPDDTLRAAYLSLSEGRDGVELVEQTAVMQARDALRDALPRELERLAGGESLPALGEGRICDHCAARGLCRRDFWKT